MDACDGRETVTIDNSSISRGSDEDQDRGLAELEAAEAAENFPSGGSVILAESPAHALESAEEMKAQGHRTIVRGVMFVQLRRCGGNDASR